MQDQPKPDRSVRNKNILVAVTIFTLVTFNLAQLYIRNAQEEEQEERYTNKKKELVRTYDKLDAIQNELDDRIKVIRQMNGKVDSMITLRNQVAREKYAISQAKDLAEDRYQEIRGRLSQYLAILKEKEEETEKLREEYQSALAQNSTLKVRLDELANRNNQLSDRMKEAGEKIDARGIKLFSVAKNGKREAGNTFDGEEVKRLIVDVAIEANRFAEAEEKTVYISIMAPNEQFLSNPMGETFRFQNQDIFFSAKKDFQFDPEQGSNLEIEYTRNSKFEPGKYQLKIYCDNQVLGVETFEVVTMGTEG